MSSGSSAALLSAYFAGYALLLLPGGILVDRIGSRRVAVVGLVLFVGGAAVGAVSNRLGLLVATRLVQGAGAGLVSPAALTGAISGFPPERRGVPLGIWGASAGVANLIGPLLGGVLTSLFGWRADWWVLVPLGLAATAAIAVRLPVSRALHPSAGRSWPLNGVVVAATIVAAVTFAVMIGAFYLIEQYLQISMHYSALRASAVLALVALVVALTAPTAGRLADTRGERLTALLGFLLAAFGLGVLGAPGMHLDSALGLALVATLGVGLGLLFVPTSRAGLSSAPESSHGRVSAMLSLGRLLGAMLGSSVAGTVIAGGPSVSSVHQGLLVGSAVCVVLGMPAANRFGGSRRRPG